MNQYLQQTEKNEVKNWINSNLKNYLKKQPEIVGEIEHIIDFLNSDKAPTRLRKMSYNEAYKSSKKWVETLKKKGADILETENDITYEVDFGDGMRLVKLVGENAFKREGHLMSHCVSSYYDKNDTAIYSLRDSSNKPHCTIEVSRGDSINQIKGKGNGSIHPKYIDYVIKSLEYFGMEVRSHDMVNLGYNDITGDYFNFIQSNFTGLRYISLKDKVFMYNNSKLVRK